MSHQVRRVDTGIGADGRSAVLFDDVQVTAGRPRILWCTGATPADNSGADDAGCEFSTEMFGTPGSNFMLFELPPAEPDAPAFVHTTNTIDYIVVLKGRIELTLDTGSVELGPGDVIVDRGVRHSWRALGGEPAVSIGVLLPSHPIGEGATI